MAQNMLNNSEKSNSGKTGIVVASIIGAAFGINALGTAAIDKFASKQAKEIQPIAQFTKVVPKADLPAILGGNEPSLLGGVSPTFVKDTGSTYLGDAFNFVYSPYQYEKTTLRLIGSSAYDSTSGQVQSMPTMAVKEIHLPVALDQIAVGDTLRFKSKDWTVDSVKVSANSATLNIRATDGEKVILQHGSSFNLGSTNAMVSMGVLDSTGAKPLFDAKTTIISVFDSLSFVGKEFTPGGNFKLSDQIGGEIFSFNFVDSTSTKFNFTPTGMMGFNMADSTMDSTFAIKLPIAKLGFMDLDSAYLVPASDSIIYKLKGDSTFSVFKGANGVLMVNSDAKFSSPMQFYFDKTRMGIVILETAASKKQVWSIMPITQNADGSYAFNDVYYTGPNDAKPVNYGAKGVISRRGSKITPGSLDYSHNIAKAIWSVAAKDSAGTPTSVQEEAFQNNGSSVIYPNPASGVASLKLNTADVSSVGIYGLNGKLVLEDKDIMKNEGNYEFNVQGLRSGVYFINVGHANGTVETLKLIIEK